MRGNIPPGVRAQPLVSVGVSRFFWTPSAGSIGILDALAIAPTPLLRKGSTLIRVDDGMVVCAELAIADRFWPRFRGLLGRRGIEPDEGLLIRPARSIHMFWMRFAIDALFLDDQGEIRHIASDLRPWRMASCRGAREVVELRAGRAAQLGLDIGQRLTVEPQR